MSDTVRVTGSPTIYKANLFHRTRIEAVQCALELIHAHASAGCTATNFEEHMNALSDYADKIEAAVNKKS